MDDCRPRPDSTDGPKSASIDVRPAVVAEAAAIALMSRDEIEIGLGWSYTPARIESLIAHAGTNVVVARDGTPGDADACRSSTIPSSAFASARASPDGPLLGFAVMAYPHDHSTHLMLLAVAPHARRRGVASRLLDWLEATARFWGARQVTLECRAANGPARRFYAQRGYVELGLLQAHYRHRGHAEDGVRIVLDLASLHRAAASGHAIRNGDSSA